MKTAIRGFAVVALMLSATAAFAVPITATITLTAASGTIGATPIGGVNVTIVAVGDTSANSQFVPGVFGEPASVTITIPGVGTTMATAPSPLLIYGESLPPAGGIGSLLMNEIGMIDPAFSGYRALTSIGPITNGAPQFGLPLTTGLGTLTFTSARLITFQAVVGANTIPMLPPMGLIALTLLLAAAAFWQLRRAH